MSGNWVPTQTGNTSLRSSGYGGFTSLSMKHMTPVRFSHDFHGPLHSLFTYFSQARCHGFHTLLPQTPTPVRAGMASRQSSGPVSAWPGSTVRGGATTHHIGMQELLPFIPPSGVKAGSDFQPYAICHKMRVTSHCVVCLTRGSSEHASSGGKPANQDQTTNNRPLTPSPRGM